MRELLALLFVGLLSPAIRVLPSVPAAIAGEAGWLSSLFALPVALGLCWALFRLLRGMPEGTGLGECIQRVLGKPLGKGVLLIYLVWGLVLLVVNTRLYAQRFLSTGYRNTTLLLFVAVLLAVVLWMARGKLSAFARAGEIFYLILSITLGAVLFFALWNVEAEHILPIWIEDLPGVLGSSVPVLSTLGYAVFGAFLAGAVTRRTDNRRRAIRWTVAFCLVLTVLQFIDMGNFGPALTARMEQPFFMMVKGVGVQGAFQRVESIVMALWALSDLVFIGLLTMACCRISGILFCLKREKTAAAPIVLLAFSGALLLFQDIFRLDWFADKVVPLGNLALGFLLPALILVVDRARRKC